MKQILIGLKNFWKFRREIYSFRDYDYIFTLRVLKRLLEEQRDGMDTFLEEGSKGTNINEAINYLGTIIDEDFYGMAEKEMGLKLVNKFEVYDDDNNFSVFNNNMLTLEERENNKKIYERGNALSEEAWEKFFESLKNNESGQPTAKGVSSWWY